MSGIKRDRWDRPLIIPLDADGYPDLAAKPVPYTRVSTSAGSLDDKSNLMKWKQRVTSLGLGRRPDLMMRVQSILANYDDPLNDLAAKSALNEIVDATEEAGGGNTASGKGTAWHEFTEALDKGRKLGDLGADIIARLEGYREATSHLTVLDMEMFVVNDVTKTAGSFDRLYGCPDGFARVGDLKTGKDDPNYPLKVCIQIADYANSMRYDPDTGIRTPLHPELDKTRGILVHMPDRGEGTQLYDLDLVRGWEAAQVAAVVHGIRKWKKNDLCRAA